MRGVTGQQNSCVLGLKHTFDACSYTILFTVELVDLLIRYYRAPDEVAEK